MSIADKWVEYEIDIRPGPLTGAARAAFYGGAAAALRILDQAEDPEATLQHLLLEVGGYPRAKSRSGHPHETTHVVTPKNPRSRT
jgi:hypothetical protein